ncbi:MutS domain III [Chitinophaga costaii]|uniref:MutS domain III n=1 Tax=Chitinophaga costaii TaxID=1335309 RepID=A0A1C4EP82_9BACT|nr:DNA mismatch repair protein [Chitinophaga costaii]PUZ22491.1 DNA mismatch repair protein [Chitinophaga costaii]SCC45445.1 MutS domain III [Chitinophaga costaii]
MAFITDKQTLEDLHIFGRQGSDAVYNIFHRTHTRGGGVVLENMFRYPLSNQASIQQRSDMIRYFREVPTEFPFPPEWFDVVEQYLENTDERTKLSTGPPSQGRMLHHLMGGDTAYKTIYKGVTTSIQLLHALRVFIDQLPPAALESGYQSSRVQIGNLLADEALVSLLDIHYTAKLSFEAVAALDRDIRFRQRDKIKQALEYIYHLDVYIAVARVAGERGFVMPTTLPAEAASVYLEGVYHPQVKNAVGNTLHITPESNIVFLTGANMAGKSTFMKTLGIAIYLAHMGFPVPAAKMEFSVRDGLLTTINLADNLHAGVSHFYAEVLRIKKMADTLKQAKNLFIIVDELFRGTNVKDAYEATIAITGAFAKQRQCMFVVSTHIIEAGEALQAACSNIHFVYLPTRMEQQVPVYTYQLKNGITADRHGMVIINHENIIPIIRSRKKNVRP